MAAKAQVVLVWVTLTAAIIWGEMLYSSFGAGSQLLPTIVFCALFGAAGTVIIIAALYALDLILGRVISLGWIKL